MSRRRFTCAATEQRCEWAITLRDGSEAQCGRAHTDGQLCRQHRKMWEARSCAFCGMNDELPPGHYADCTRDAPSPKEPTDAQIKDALAAQPWTPEHCKNYSRRASEEIAFLRAALATRGPIGAVEPTDEQIYQCYLTMTTQSPIKFARAILALSRTPGAAE